MTPPSLQDHATAVIDLLRAQPDLTVYPRAEGGTTTVPNGAAPPYVVVDFYTSRDLDGRMSMASTHMLLRIYAQCIGANRIAANAVSDLVAAALLDVRPTIAGRRCYPIRQDVGSPARPDDSLGETVVTLTEVYRLESDPG